LQVGGLSVPSLSSTNTTGTSLITKLVTQWNYDTAGNTLSVIERPTTGLAKAQFNIFDALNRVTAQISPREGITSFTYDAAWNTTSVRDATHNVTEWTLDRRNRTTAETVTLTAMDANNVPTAGFNQKQQLFAYDDLDRLTERTDRNGAAGDMSMTGCRG